MIEWQLHRYNDFKTKFIFVKKKGWVGGRELFWRECCGSGNVGRRVWAALWADSQPHVWRHRPLTLFVFSFHTVGHAFPLNLRFYPDPLDLKAPNILPTWQAAKKAYILFPFPKTYKRRRRYNHEQQETPSHYLSFIYTSHQLLCSHSSLLTLHLISSTIYEPLTPRTHLPFLFSIIYLFIYYISTHFCI